MLPPRWRVVVVPSVSRKPEISRIRISICVDVPTAEGDSEIQGLWERLLGWEISNEGALDAGAMNYQRTVLFGMPGLDPWPWVEHSPTCNGSASDVIPL